MDKSKAIRSIIIYLIILMMCMFLVGFFSGKNVYAAESGNTEENTQILENVLRNYCDDEEYLNIVIPTIVSKNNFIDNYMAIFYLQKYNKLSVLTSLEPLQVSFNDLTSSKTLRFRGTEFGVDFDSVTYYLGNHTSPVSHDNGGIYLRETQKGYNEKQYLFVDGKYKIINEPIYANYNILYNDQFEDVGIMETEVFFLKANRAILSPLMKSVEMGKVLEQVIFLIPTSLGLVVSFLALRKVLQLLRTLLHRA